MSSCEIPPQTGSSVIGGVRARALAYAFTAPKRLMHAWLPFTERSLTYPALQRHMFGPEQTPFGQPSGQCGMQWKMLTSSKMNPRLQLQTFGPVQAPFRQGRSQLAVHCPSFISYPGLQEHVSGAVQTPWKHPFVQIGSQPASDGSYPTSHSQTPGATQRPL